MTDQLKSTVDRIERLEEQQRGVLADKRRVYDEAKAAGYNVKALRKIIAQRREKDWPQIAADMHEYQIRLGMAVNDVVDGASLRQAAERHGVSKSAVHRAVPQAENSQQGQPSEAGGKRPVAATDGSPKSTGHRATSTGYRWRWSRDSRVG